MFYPRKNILPPKIKDLVIEVIDTCNARCVMCNIWKNKVESQISDLGVKNLPRSLRNINISGGEPFLRPDLPEFIKKIKIQCPKARIIISTNGFLPEKIESQVKKILQIDPEIGVGVSIDGRDGLHDTIRGVPGGFEKCLETIQKLQKLNVKSLRLGFTATEENVHGLGEVYRLADELGVELTCGIAHNSGIYFRTEGNNGLDGEALRTQLNGVAGRYLRGWNFKKWARSFFYQGVVDRSKGLPRRIPCTAGGRSGFLAATGKVHPCNVLDTTLGSLNENSFDTIWDSPDAQAARDFAPTCPENCWMVCTARESIKTHPLRVFQWVFRAKLRAHRRKDIY